MEEVGDSLYNLNDPELARMSPGTGVDEYIRFQLAHAGLSSKGRCAGPGGASGSDAAIVFRGFRSRFRGCSTVRHPDLAGAGGSVGSGGGGTDSGGEGSSASG